MTLDPVKRFGDRLVKRYGDRAPLYWLFIVIASLLAAAILGGFAVDGLIGLVQWALPTPEMDHAQSGELFHTVRHSGWGPGAGDHIGEWGVHEYWSWTVEPLVIRIGDDARIRMHCRITEYEWLMERIKKGRISPYEIRDFAEEFARLQAAGRFNGEEEDVASTDLPMAVMVLGNLKWHSSTELTLPAGSPIPLDWSWTFTAQTVGSDQLIQIVLPELPDGSQRFAKTRAAPDSALDPSTRFHVIHLRVLSRYGFAPGVDKAIGTLKWLVGPAVIGKFLLAARKRRSRKEQPSTC
jgi:hypothetical protein